MNAGRQARKLTGVIGVLHNSHELNDVVAKGMDAWQGVSCELFVRPNPVFRSGYPHMRFVDTRAARRRRPLVLELISLRCGRIPEPSVVHRGDRQVLRDSFNPRRNTLDTLSTRYNQRDLGKYFQRSGAELTCIDAHLDLGVVGNRAFPSWRRRHGDLPDTKVVLGHWVRDAVPVIYSGMCEDAQSEPWLRDYALNSPMRTASTALGAHSR